MATPPTPPTGQTNTAPQQQSAPTGTTSPKTRRFVFSVMLLIVIALLYNMLRPSAARTPRHATNGQDVTPSEEQIEAATRASRTEIEQEKLKREREKKRQEITGKTADFNRTLATTQLPRIAAGGGSKRFTSSAPSIVFDTAGDEHGNVQRKPELVPAQYSNTTRGRQQQAFELAREIADASQKQAGQQQQSLPNELATDGFYGPRQKPRDTQQIGQPQQETALPANFLYPDPAWPKTILPEGTVIETVLKNRLEGGNYGPVEVMLTTDVYLRGTHKLIFPQGTTISGETKRVSLLDQERLAVTFHRALVELPDGTLYGVTFDSPGLDQAGVVGLHGHVNHHYFQLFGTSLAVGAIGGLVNIGNTSGGYNGYDSTSLFRSGIGSELGITASQIMARYLNRLPTIVISEGTRVKIMLTGDLPVPLYPGEEDAWEQTQ